MTIRKLPDTELEVMQAVWGCEPPVSRGEIDAILKDTHPMALTTLLTLLTRLSEKGFLSVTIEKRKKYYSPLIPREDYQISQSKSFFQKVCGGNLSAFANALCEGGLTKEEVTELRRLLEEGQL
jgi:predicted transcriptional regulator